MHHNSTIIQCIEACWVAGLDKENEALQERLAMLTQESQRKDSVNQSLTHELASYAQAQQQAQQQAGTSD